MLLLRDVGTFSFFVLIYFDFDFGLCLILFLSSDSSLAFSFLFFSFLFFSYRYIYTEEGKEGFGTWWIPPPPSALQPTVLYRTIRLNQTRSVRIRQPPFSFSFSLSLSSLPIFFESDGGWWRLELNNIRESLYQLFDFTICYCWDKKERKKERKSF